MKKRTIVIASILKPIDDTRMYEKFGVSLGNSGDYDVVIIGYPSTAQPTHRAIRFLPLNSFKRLSLSRLIAPLKVMAKVFQVKHDILIVNTHELLIVAFLNRILFGRKIFYDIQENYYRNIRFTDTFPGWIRGGLALWVRAKEKLTAPWFHGFFLAEKGYENEFDFMGKKFTIIENKPVVIPQFVHKNRPGNNALLFSGTLSESTGVFEAIALAKKLYEADPSITLHVIGYASQHETYVRLKLEIEGFDFISLTGGNHLVPHHEILKAIGQAGFGIIIYPTSPHTQNAMPTKLYEYVGYRLPILLQNHPKWVSFCQPFEAAIVLEEHLNPQDLLSMMKSKTFYTKTQEPVYWSSEETKLLGVLASV